MEKVNLEMLAALTGLDEAAVTRWLKKEMEVRGLSGDEFQLEDVRKVLADLLQDLILTQ